MRQGKRTRGCTSSAEPERVDGLPEVHLEYAFIGGGGEDEQERTIPVLVLKEADTRMCMASVVPKKGTFGVSAAKRALNFLKEIGLDRADLVLKSDQEPAIVAFTDDIKKARTECRTVVERSPVPNPQSNGMIERTVRSIKEHVKVMKSALEAKWGRR